MEAVPLSRSDVSLVRGGPAHRLQEWLGLVRPEDDNLPLRAGLAILITWVPLLILSAVQGAAVGHNVRIPFLGDYAAYARYFVAIPLLIFAEGLIGHRVAQAIHQFVNSGLITSRQLAHFDAILARGRGMRDSGLAELAALALAALCVVIAKHALPFDFPTWHSTYSSTGGLHTWAGWWELIVGRGLFFFLGVRWLWRMFIWYWALWRISKLDLQLIPTHPDRAAGLGFLGETQAYFWGIVVAFSATLSGALADEVVYAGRPLQGYEVPIVIYVLMVLLVFLGPLLMYMPKLVEAKVKAQHQYAALAITHNRLFDDKWVQGNNPKGDSLLGTPEISSLADLSNAYDVLDRMRPIPFDVKDAISLALAALVPMAPLLLTIMPLDKIIELISHAFV